MTGERFLKDGERNAVVAAALEVRQSRLQSRQTLKRGQEETISLLIALHLILRLSFLKKSKI
jgi:hypothetical protein